MTRWLSMMMVVCVSTAYANMGNTFKHITGAIGKEVAAVKDPLEKTVVSIGFSQCSHVKKLIGVDYEEKDEPDLSKLTLNFITPAVKMRFNLTALPHVTSSKYFNASQGLVIYMHGFIDDPSKAGYTDINTSFMKQGYHNIVALDASSLIRFFYLRASTMVRYIGETLGASIANAIKAGLDPKKVYLVGHSLGSHIAGFTGKAVQRLSGKRVGRISGLDPAGPCFADVESGLKLNKTDADFVDVIHTDAGVLGLNERIGHVDFSPNSGSEQAGCVLQTCSHSRAWAYFSESVRNPYGFPAVRCDSWAAYKKNNCVYTDIKYMGIASVAGTTGLYFLQTNSEAPYALGLNGTVFNNNDGVVRTIRDKLHFFK